MPRKKKRSAWGSVIERKDRGWFAVRVPVDGAPGKYRIYRQDSKADAEAKLKELRGLHDAGRLVVREKDAPEKGKAEGGLTLLEAIDAFIAAKKTAGKAKKTLESYRGIRNVIAFEESPLASVTVDAVDREMLLAYQDWRREHVFRIIAPPVDGVEPKMEHREGVTASNATINRDVTLIKAALNLLVKDKRLEENPAKGIEFGDEREKLPVDISDEEAVRLLASCRADLRPIVKTALYTGARKGEVLGLTWGDVNLDEATLNLTREKTPNASVLHLPPDLVTELRALRGDRIPDLSEKVFGLQDIRSAWRAAVKDAGLAGKRGFTFHSTRHTFATKYLGEGGTIYELKEILGHSNIATTMKYLHMVDERVRKVMSGFSYGALPKGQIRTHERTQGDEAVESAEAGAA